MRRPVVNRTVQQSIEEFVEHSIAMWYESGADAPLSTQKLTQHHTEQAIKQYEFLGIDYGLNPDVLWYTMRFPQGAPKIKDYFSTLQQRDPAVVAEPVLATA